MHSPDDLVLLPALYLRPFKNDKHSMLKVKFKTGTGKGIGKYELKHDFKTLSFKIKCVVVHERCSVCLYSLSRFPSYKHMCNNLRCTTGMASRGFIFCFRDSLLPFGGTAVFCFVLSNSVDTYSIIMTFLTADGRGEMVGENHFPFMQ